jgi:hypothetical protein
MCWTPQKSVVKIYRTKEDAAQKRNTYDFKLDILCVDISFSFSMSLLFLAFRSEWIQWFINHRSVEPFFSSKNLVCLTKTNISSIQKHNTKRKWYNIDITSKETWKYFHIWKSCELFLLAFVIHIWDNKSSRLHWFHLPRFNLQKHCSTAKLLFFPFSFYKLLSLSILSRL